MRATIQQTMTQMGMGMRSQRKLFGFVFVAASLAVAGCGELTGPKSPETPINVVATLVSPISVRLDWSPSPQSDGVVSYNVFRNGVKIAESPSAQYLDTGLAEKTVFKYTVSANCKSGVLSDASPESPAGTVTTGDITPPRIILISPANGQTNVSTAATVAATFNEAIDPTTINTTTFSLKVTATGANIPGTVTYTVATRVAEFKPTNALPSPASITATITSGVKDLAGNALVLTAGSPGVWSFTTVDQTPPTVVSTTPADGATGVSATAPITVTFSEPMDASAINATNITVRVTGGASVAGTVTYNNSTNVATFTPSSALAAPVNYTVTVLGAVKDVAGNQMGANYVFTFTTRDTAPPTVTSTSPANLATNVPTNAVISATFNKAMDPTTISTTTFLLRVTATSAPVTGTVAYNAATFTATFTPSAALGSAVAYTATITTGAKDASSNALAASFPWTFSTVDNVPPTVTAVSPTNGATNVAVNSAVNITFSKAMDPTTINGTTITLKTTVTSTAVTGVVSYNAATNVATFTPSGALAFGTGYTVTVTTGAKDLAGNMLAAPSPSTFTTAAAPDTTPPTVTSTVPTDGATNVAINTTVVATFSEPMDQATITGTTFTLKTTSGGTPVTGTVTYDVATMKATFTPSAPLLNSTGYTATITTGVKDLAGNQMVADKVVTFTTAPDTTPPIVTSTSPTNNAPSVPINTVVTVSFNEAMDPATVTVVGTFTLKATVSGTPVAGTVTYNSATFVATFTPTAVLLAGTNYTATVTTAAKDAAGNPLSPGNLVFAFATAPPP